ncbi:MAG: CotH kinase family protein [Candidatus Izemoplasmatales bacterium]|nr:CotH kinase family protein [Candidatus Izemoplasmatales bacterium]
MRGVSTTEETLYSLTLNNSNQSEYEVLDNLSKDQIIDLSVLETEDLIFVGWSDGDNLYYRHYTVWENRTLTVVFEDPEEVFVIESSPNDKYHQIAYDMKLYDEGLEITEENFFLVGGIPFVIKSPDFEDDHYSNEQYLFISNYFQLVYDTLVNQEDYYYLIDIDRFIDWFIVNEVMKNVDSGYSSVYFHKDKGKGLKMGPVWDFDLSSGNPGHLQEDLRGPEGWYTSRSDKNVFFYFLMQYESFQEALKLRWNEVYETILLEMLASIYPLVDSMARSRYLNFQTWDIIGKNDEWYTASEILELVTYEEQVWFLLDYLTKRVEWLNTEINLL